MIVNFWRTLFYKMVISNEMHFIGKVPVPLGHTFNVEAVIGSDHATLERFRDNLVAF